MRRTGLLLLPLLVLLAACGLPTSGVVHHVAIDGETSTSGAFDYLPRSPRRGDSPAAIVSGFLDALRQVPLTYSVAREYLTKEARSVWQPTKRTVVYDDGGLATELLGDTAGATTAAATVTVSSSVELDSRGAWLGDPTDGAGQSFQLELAKEGGQWRLAQVPDALIVPRSHFDTRFDQYDLYFLDPTSTSVVPEPVYLPVGQQTATQLVAGLLAGPAPELRSVERTAIPQGTQLDLSVPVDDGTAEIPLDDKVLGIDDQQLDLVYAQLAWTLRQVSGVTRMRITVHGTPVGGNAGTRSVTGWESLDPAESAGALLYALQGGNVVVASTGAKPVPFSTALAGTPLRSLAVSLEAQPRLAGVTVNGQSVVMSTATGPAAEVARGTDLLRPAFDRVGDLWLVDRTASGARVLVADKDGVHELSAAGISGRAVTAFELSRDGTRFAALVDGALVLSRIGRSEAGVPTSLSPAVRLPSSPDATGAALDLAWVSPDHVGVLLPIGPNSAEVALSSVDGAVFGDAVLAEPVFEPVTDLVSWPGAGAATYVRGVSGPVYQLTPGGHWEQAGMATDLASPVFPG